MKNQNYRVSGLRSITLELLVNCDLMKKHRFRKNLAQYEKSYGYKQHPSISVDCGKVLELQLTPHSTDQKYGGRPAEVQDHPPLS